MMGVILLLAFSLVFLVMFTEQGRDLIAGAPTSVFGSAISFSSIDWDSFYSYLVSSFAGELYLVSVVVILFVAANNVLKSGRPVR